MRIHLVLAKDTDNSGITEATFELLHEALSTTDDVELTDENPDVIHIIGEWDRKSMTIARDALSRHIATVQSPLSSMAPWKDPSSSKLSLTMNMQALIASGQIEHDYLEDEKHPDQTHIVRNAVTTATTTREKMVTEVINIYKEVVETADKDLWQKAEKQMELINEDDETIKNICRHFIYASHLYIRRNIPHSFLATLTDIMHKAEYNEDRMAEILKLIKLYDFTACLETVMHEECNLMEGYMPIPALEDKTSKKIASYITNY